MRGGYGHGPGEVREVHPVLSALGAGDDGQEAVAPLDLLGYEGGADLAGGARGFGRTVEEDHQLELLQVEGVRGHAEEGAGLVDDVADRERTDEEEVVLARVHHKVDAHLVHDDGLALGRDGCPQQFAVDLAPDQEGLPHVGHADLQAQPALLRADNRRFAEGHSLGPLLGEGDLGQDDPAHEAVDDGTDERLDDDEGHRPGALARDGPPAVADGGLRLEGVEEGGGEPVDVADAGDVALGVTLARQVPVPLGDPVPQQAENEPASGEGRYEEEDHETPADLHEGGPEVLEEGEVAVVLDVAELDVAAPVFGHQATSANSAFRQVVVDAFLHELEHSEAEERKAEQHGQAS